MKWDCSRPHRSRTIVRRDLGGHELQPAHRARSGGADAVGAGARTSTSAAPISSRTWWRRSRARRTSRRRPTPRWPRRARARRPGSRWVPTSINDPQRVRAVPAGAAGALVGAVAPDRGLRGVPRSQGDGSFRDSHDPARGNRETASPYERNALQRGGPGVQRAAPAISDGADVAPLLGFRRQAVFPAPRRAPEKAPKSELLSAGTDVPWRRRCCSARRSLWPRSPAPAGAASLGHSNGAGFPVDRRERASGWTHGSRRTSR
jgi:hypothetical protein